MHRSFACRNFGFCIFLLFSFAAPSPASDVRDGRTRLQQVVDDLTRQLELQTSVTAVIVQSNPLLVSVEPSEAATDAFVLSFEEGFLNQLAEEEVRAVVAHELGHVWIFTHHPYLHTERLANSVAMRVVSRQSLEDVYVKVWERAGTKGDMVRFLGQ